ncbi:tryptophan--tRNA ligase, cytoplasmic-like [Humulus lupulus]|uniref:tryptophan--tRNA ligase, cytoplasmic-like n=1 Tax=Humulus lupulus TaxID=3486 RepID=UPI002B40FABA|nr:tryptophan--tRNA ligase, cytoplasmic-like [Humulus lupulus]XP_062079697.1 tryptophan--tRNA ligase, cytoplasmic-like [Humulus lupulus]XP_062079698.1 tryptophan--tRNA ligase, cytoplasmic-like [Humulus lupulus]
MEKKEETQGQEPEQEQVANPWEVSAKDGGKIDYDMLIDQFGCQRLDQSPINCVHRLTFHPPHVFLLHYVFFAHRDFNDILDAYERARGFISILDEVHLLRLCIWAISFPLCSPNICKTRLRFL